METEAIKNDKSLQILKKHVPNKKVLDVGCVGQADKWTRHNYIADQKPSFLLGIDITVTEDMNQDNIEYCDITNKVDVNGISSAYGDFDIIVLYDMLEHVDNVGLAIDNLKYITNDYSKIFVSTPNAISDKWVNQMKQNNRTNINPDHIHWFCYQTLEYLFRRYGWETLNIVSEVTEPRLVQIFWRK